MQEKNTRVDEDKLLNSFESNPDGVGYSYINSGKLVTKKYRSYDKFVKAYNKDIKNYSSKSPFLLHFRLATHGEHKGTINVHPFKVMNGLVFAHNGIINKVDDDKVLSDTQVFNRDVLQKLSSNFLKSDGVKELISSYIGTSKLAFLNKDGSYDIINESLGHWLDGIWYSNKSYQSCNVYGMYRGFDSIAAWDDTSSVTDLWKSSSTKADPPSKYSNSPTLECNYCSDLVYGLTHFDIGDRYEGEDPHYMWLCDECIEIEEDYEELESGRSEATKEIVEWNKSFTLDGGK
tara:strand:+ start:4048 stop:4917 length:870 start_codon:yes stop_codon:yes gene_type:complete